MKDTIGKRINTIKSQSQSHHIELCTRITFNSCRIAYMTKNLMRKTFLKLYRSTFEHFYLFSSKRIELSAIATH